MWDEDVITMSFEAARSAMARSEIQPGDLRAVWVGTEPQVDFFADSRSRILATISAGSMLPSSRKQSSMSLGI